MRSTNLLNLIGQEISGVLRGQSRVEGGLNALYNSGSERPGITLSLGDLQGPLTIVAVSRLVQHIVKGSGERKPLAIRLDEDLPP